VNEELAEKLKELASIYPLTTQGKWMLGKTMKVLLDRGHDKYRRVVGSFDTEADGRFTVLAHELFPLLLEHLNTKESKSSSTKVPDSP
jgi:hypothetical protein